VRDPEQHRQVCGNINEWVSSLEGWQVIGIDKSPVTGADGNVEFLIVARNDV
jgi:23S rRNA (cytidine1920-2'-O)/16S rRNA (cytidine1409-2'-O)-methyltransferase